MLTDEFIAEHAERMNKILEFADERGDTGASLGTMVMLSLNDDDFEFVRDLGSEKNPARFKQIMRDSQARFQRFGVAPDDE